jgi:hypothetical protein
MHTTKSQIIGITGREKGLQDDWMVHQEVKCEVCWRWSLQTLPCFFGHLHPTSKFPNVKWKRYTASQKTLSQSYRAAWLQNMIGRDRPIDYNLHSSWPQKTVQLCKTFNVLTLQDTAWIFCIIVSKAMSVDKIWVRNCTLRYTETREREHGGGKTWECVHRLQGKAASDSKGPKMSTKPLLQHTLQCHPHMP